uniref:Secreted protein n=1 Tax=Anopheles coluzzii TaxID=1518534 RepID=A0A8W7PUD5_ANOCL
MLPLLLLLFAYFRRVELERILEEVFDAHQRNGVGQDLQRGVRVNFLRMFLQNVDHHFVIRHQAAGMQRHITPIFRVLLQHPAGEFEYQLLEVSAQLLQVLHRTVVPEQRRAGHFRLRVEQLQGALVLPLGLVQYDQLDHFSSVVSMMASSAATFLSVVPSGFVLAPLRNGNRLSVRKQADHIDRIGVELRKLLHRLAEVLVDEQVMFALLRNVDRLNAPQMGHGGHIQQSLLATHQKPRFMQLRNALDQCALVLHVVKHAHLDGIVDQPNRVRIVPHQTLERFAPDQRFQVHRTLGRIRLNRFRFHRFNRPGHTVRPFPIIRPILFRIVIRNSSFTTANTLSSISVMHGSMVFDELVGNRSTFRGCAADIW